MSTVIVFGPTGNVASIAARTAQAHGSKIILAMRDLQKLIPGLTREQEQAGGFQRVQADLTDPDSAAAAVKCSGATRAFIYWVQTPDNMKSTLEALKFAGIKFVVFLSSYTISGELSDVPSHDLIPYFHAQVELSLDEVFGDENYVAVRPGAFATNILGFKAGIIDGDVPIYGGDFKMDCITPSDMGRVSGTVLVTGSKNNQKKVYLYGPQVLTQREAIGVIGDFLGMTVKVSSIGPQEALDQFLSTGVPKPLADYMVNKLGNAAEDGNSKRAQYETGVANVELYTGRPATGFLEWVKENRSLFST